jgi:tetratricopeptide (TPR) repeat protein
MKFVLEMVCALWAVAAAGPVLAQNGGAAGGRPEATAQDAAAGRLARAKVQVSDAGRAALAAAKELAGRGKGLRGGERAQALEQAAAAYDKVAADFAAEPAVAGAAAFAAAELWRQHGSLPLAEKDYLLAAETDAPRFLQRGLLGAADMQRRQKRNDEALATYGKAAAAEPAGPRAQEARLWQARLLQTLGRLDPAIAAFQSALESARPGRQVVEAANYLALACVQKGDFDAAERAIEHAEQAVAGAGEDDPVVAARLQKAIESMSARKALQRARDKQAGAGKDAARLDEARGR